MIFNIQVNHYPIYNQFVTALRSIPPAIKAISEKVAKLVIPYYDLNNNLTGIIGRVKKDAAYTLNADELSQLKTALNKSQNIFGDKLFKAALQMPNKDIINAILLMLNEIESESKLEENLIQLLKKFSTKELASLLEYDAEKIQEKLQSQTLLRDEALKNVLQTKSKAVWKEVLNEAVYFFHHILEVFIVVSGVTEVGGEKKNQRFSSGSMEGYQAKAKLELFLAMLAYPSVLFSASFAILGSAAAAGLTTGLIILLTLAAISFYMRYLKPCPNAYMGLDNLNQKAMLILENPPIFKRLDILTRIQNAFAAGKGVILTADPGEGKTSVVDSLAELIVSGTCRDFLKKVQLFSGNANGLKGVWPNSLNFTELKEVFKNHKKEFGLFLDEIESAFQDNNLTGKPLNDLLTFQDQFRYIICATTTKQFNETIKDKEEAFNRRFVHIEVPKLKPNELGVALYEHVHFKAPELVLEDKVIPYIIENASTFNSKTSQVDAATSLLACAIDKATYFPFETLETEINNLDIEIISLKKHFLHSVQTTKREMEEYNQKLKQLDEKKAELAKKQDEVKRIKKIEKISLRFKNSCYELATENTNKDKVKIGKWLIHEACHKILSKLVVQQRNKLGLPVGISKQLIDSIIEKK